MTRLQHATVFSLSRHLSPANEGFTPSAAPIITTGGSGPCRVGVHALQQQVDRYMRDHPEEKCWGYLIRRHGLYTWGKDLSEATRHVEIIEFVLECIGRTLHR
ncbi:MAG: class II aldolase/adducin family protein [Pirellula sp.]